MDILVEAARRQKRSSKLGQVDVFAWAAEIGGDPFDGNDGSYIFTASGPNTVAAADQVKRLNELKAEIPVSARVVSDPTLDKRILAQAAKGNFYAANNAFLH